MRPQGLARSLLSCILAAAWAGRCVVNADTCASLNGDGTFTSSNYAVCLGGARAAAAARRGAPQHSSHARTQSRTLRAARTWGGAIRTARHARIRAASLVARRSRPAQVCANCVRGTTRLTVTVTDL